MLKTTALSTQAKLAHTRTKENDYDIGNGGDIDDNKIDDRIENLSSNIKVKKSSRADLLISKAKKANTNLQKDFNNALIFRHFDLKCPIRVENNT